MHLCQKCHGKHLSTVKVITRTYAQDTYFTYRTLACECRAYQHDHSTNEARESNGREEHQMPLL